MNTGKALMQSHGRIEWRPIGPGWGEGGPWAYRSRRLAQWWNVALFIWLVFPNTMVWLAARRDDTGMSGLAAFSLFALCAVLAMTLCLWPTYVEVDGHGITVVNAVRVQRVPWSDIDVVQVAGRPAITVLTSHRRITCWALNQRPGDLLPWSKFERRRMLEDTAQWMREMSAAARAPDDRARTQGA